MPDFPKVRSLRSGPSWGKVALDARGVLEIRRLVARTKPRAVLAHHIEAACAALAARVSPVYFVVHTDLERELPVYFAPHLSPVVRAAGRSLENLARDRAAGVAAVSPRLAERARGLYLPVPWPPTTIESVSREQARQALGIARTARVGLYAGNLDAYQGWEHLIEALAIARRSDPRARLLVATEADPRDLRAEARRAGVGRAVYVRPLLGERARALSHCASDFAWIPRRIEGGLPIKMLDAFARGLPAVVMRRATAGLDVGVACALVPDDDALALAGAGAALCAEPRRASRLAARARAYLAAHHSNESFTRALDRLLGAPSPPAPRRAAAPAPRAR